MEPSEKPIVAETEIVGTPLAQDPKLHKKSRRAETAFTRSSTYGLPHGFPAAENVQGSPQGPAQRPGLLAWTLVDSPGLLRKRFPSCERGLDCQHDGVLYVADDTMPWLASVGLRANELQRSRAMTVRHNGSSDSKPSSRGCLRSVHHGRHLVFVHGISKPDPARRFPDRRWL
jgi:hypothetical protein